MYDTFSYFIRLLLSNIISNKKKLIFSIMFELFDTNSTDLTYPLHDMKKSENFTDNM